MTRSTSSPIRTPFLGRPPGEGRRRRSRLPAGRRVGARPADGRSSSRAQDGDRPVRGRRPRRVAAARLRARGPLPGRRRLRPARPLLVPADDRRARPPPRRRGPPRGAVRAARRAPARDGRGDRGRVRGLGAERALGRASSATSTAGTAGCTRCARSAPPGSGSSSSRASEPGSRYKFEIRTQDGRLRLKADPFALPRRAAAARTPRSSSSRGTSGGTRSGSERARVGRPARASGLDLRGAPRLLAAEPGRGQPPAHLPRAGRRAGRVRDRHGLHARRAAAGDGASLHALLGLPGDRVLRADLALRRARTTSARSSTACTGPASA